SADCYRTWQALLVKRHSREVSSMGIQLKVRNYRCLRNVEWSPDGVCVLVGPNGSGKTTLFDALDFLRLTNEINLSQALAFSGGNYFRSLDAPPQEGVEFSLRQDAFTWELNFYPGGGPFNTSLGERLVEGTEPIVERRLGQQLFQIRGQQANYPDMVGLRALTNIPTHTKPVGIASTISGFLISGSYALLPLRTNGSQPT